MLEQFDYSFPKELIAQKPTKPRDSAKLLVYNRKTKNVSFDTFLNLATYVPKNSVIVFNQTKVVPARLFATKPTGGKVEILFLQKTKTGFEGLANKSLAPKEQLAITPKLSLTVVKKLVKGYAFASSFPIAKLDDVLEQYGHTPIPPYIKSSPLSEKKLREDYQTIFSKTKGSAAAPTASLHFSKLLLGKLSQAGIQIEFVTLHVGLGTFAPVTDEQIKTKRLHKERYEIDSKTATRLNDAKREGRTIIAVGTTVVRTLESASGKSAKLKKLSGSTDLFIQSNKDITFVDSLITNFHVPKSSLMMLVASFVGRSVLLDLYKKAIARKMRLFSFGDGMLIK